MRVLKQRPMRSLFSKPLTFLIFFLAGAAFPRGLEAAQIQQVEHRTVMLDAESLGAEITLEKAVNLEKSFLNFHVLTRTPGASPAASQIAVYFHNSSTVRIVREKPGAVLEVIVSVLEFKEGVRVLHGATQFGPDADQKRIAIPKVNSKSSVLTVTATVPQDSGDQGAYLFFSGSFADSQTLSLRRAAVQKKQSEGEDQAKRPAQALPEAKVYWQVIEFTDESVRVHQGTAKIPHFAKDTSAYFAEPVAGKDRVFFLFSSRAGALTRGRESLTRIQATMTDDLFLLFARAQAGSVWGEDVEAQWYAVEFKTRSGLVQSGEVSFKRGEIEKTVEIKPVVSARSFILISSSGPGAGSAEETAALQFLGQFNGPNRLRIKRGSNNPQLAPVRVAWSVVEWPAIILKAPTGKEDLRIGETQTLEWSYSDDMLWAGAGDDREGRVELRISQDRGVDDFPYLLAADLAVSESRFEWLIPEHFGEDGDISSIGRDWLIRASVFADKTKKATDVSRPFEIKGVLELVSPVGGENWNVGDENREIRWRYRGNLGPLSIYYDTQSGFTGNAFPDNQRIVRVFPGKEGEGAYVWKPLPDLSSARMRVKILSESDPSVFSASVKDFSLAPKITVYWDETQPKNLDAASVLVVRWSCSGTVPAFDFYYRKDDFSKWIPAAQNIPGGPPGHFFYQWVIPDEAVGNRLRVKIEKSGESGVFDISPDEWEATFSIRPWIRMVVPADESRQVWRVGDKRLLKWHVGGLSEYLNLEYSVNAGADWVKAAVLRAGDRQYEWVIPDAVSDQFLIRLSDANHPGLFGMLEAEIDVIAADDPRPTSD